MTRYMVAVGAVVLVGAMLALAKVVLDARKERRQAEALAEQRFRQFMAAPYTSARTGASTVSRPARDTSPAMYGDSSSIVYDYGSGASDCSSSSDSGGGGCDGGGDGD